MKPRTPNQTATQPRSVVVLGYAILAVIAWIMLAAATVLLGVLTGWAIRLFTLGYQLVR